MRTVSVPAGRLGAPRSKRLLALSGDERLVEHIRRGDELAFEVAFERHSPAILSFCRHMLGSQEEAEDAVQQAFTSAYRDLRRDQRQINLKPWLFAIARNRCLSMLRARRERTLPEQEIATGGLAEEVEQRSDLRDVLRDLHDLPEQQRGALLMAEVSGLTHAEIAGVLDCEPHKVKALVFRARSGLIERREARDAPCLEIREELANLRGGSLRRGRLRHHLRVCDGCREYRDELKRQRSMLAAVLPVVPTLGLKQSVLGALGLGGGSAGGAGLLGGLGAAVTGKAGGATLAKIAIVGTLAGGGVVAGDAIVERPDAGPRTDPPALQRAVPAPERVAPVAAAGPAAGGGAANGPAASQDGEEAKAKPGKQRGRAGKGPKPAKQGGVPGANGHRGKAKEPGRPPAAGKKAKREHPAAGNPSKPQPKKPKPAKGPKPVKERPAQAEANAKALPGPPVKLPKPTKEERAAAKAE